MRRILHKFSACGVVAIVMTLTLGEWLRTTTFSTGVFAECQANIIGAILSKQFQLGIICTFVCYHIYFLWLKASHVDFSHRNRPLFFPRLESRDVTKSLLVIWAAGSYLLGWNNAADGDRGDLLFGVDQSENASVFLAGIVLSQIFEIAKKRAHRIFFYKALLCTFIGFLTVAGLMHFQEHAQFRYRQSIRATGLWVNPNTFGLLEGVGLILVLSVLVGDISEFLSNHKPSVRWLYAVAAGMGILLLTGLIRSLSRGSWMGTFCGAAFVIQDACRPKLVDGGPAESNLQRLGRWLKGKELSLMIVAVSIFVLLLFFSAQSEHSVVRRIFAVANANDFSWRNRLKAYEGALQLVMDHPIFGVGWNNVRPNFGNFYAPPALDDSAGIILNDYFSVAATVGLVGLVLFLKLVWISWRGTTPSINERNLGIWIGWRAATVVLLIGFWFDGGLFKLALAVPFWLFLEFDYEEKCKCEKTKSANSIWLFLVLLGFGGMIWAHSRDLFRRQEFSVRTKHGRISCTAVLPRGYPKNPTVIYVHGQHNTWMTDGNQLRQFAELGMAAVDFDYDQTNSDAFESEFAAVLEYVRRQRWADANSIAWVGFSLGAQNTFAYLLKHPENRPKVYVRLAGGWNQEMDKDFEVQGSKFNGSILLVHGENDSIFPVDDARKLAGLLRTNGTAVKLRVVAGRGHDFEVDQPVVFRLVAEDCKAILSPSHPLPEFPSLHPYPFLLCISPAFAWLGFWFYWRRRMKTAGEMPTGATETVVLPLTKFVVVLRVAAVVLGILAVADTALHLIPSRMEVSLQTLEITRKYLLAPRWHQDFETLAAMPIWQGQRLQTLLTHVELAHYTVNELVNWKVDDALYRQFVLSPVIVGGEHELNWRRELWENFYPRVRHENTTSDATAIVVRFLRQRVTIAPGYPKEPGVESMWNGHIVNPEDFEILYTAALRSVGVPARLDASRRAEFWTGVEWKTAFRPLFSPIR